MDEEEALEKLISGWALLGVEIDAYLNPQRRQLYIARIVVEKSLRGQGLGSKVMEDLVHYADTYNLLATLSPSTDFGGTSDERLKRFYRRFGFVSNKGRRKDWQIRESMYRLPHSSG